MFSKYALTAAMLVASGFSAAKAQDAVLDELYGRGVHRYFAGDYQAAYENFTLAIDNGSQDPRVYYFRGLVDAATGRQDEAKADWETGAKLEAQGTFDGQVGRSLARIQGSTRLELERVRQLARLKAHSTETARNRARYGAPSASNVPPPPRTLRNASPAPAVPPAAPDPRNNPFADDVAPVPSEPTVESTDALSGSLEAATPEPIAPAASGTPTPAPSVDSTSPLSADPFDVDADSDPFAAPPAGDEDDDPFGAE